MRNGATVITQMAIAYGIGLVAGLIWPPRTVAQALLYGGGIALVLRLIYK